jgi:hypothetical protein
MTSPAEHLLPLTTLAQRVTQQSVQILYTLGWLVLAVIVLIIAIWVIRRWLIGKQDEAPPGLTLGDLRQMRDQGHLSEEEFEATRQTLIARAQNPAGTASGAAAHSPDEAGQAPRTLSEPASADTSIELGEELLDPQQSQPPSEPGQSTDPTDPNAEANRGTDAADPDDPPSEEGGEAEGRGADSPEDPNPPENPR